MKKLIIIFPGAGYGLDSPLLYYADFLFETNGYERIHMNYQHILLRSELVLEKKLEILREYIWEQVKDIDFKQYKDIVFLSKSVGAIEAGLLAEKQNLSVQQIFLTPTEDALPYLKQDSAVIIGTKDKSYELYKTFCDANHMKVLFVEGADHSLEISGKPYESIQVLDKVMHFIENSF